MTIYSYIPTNVKPPVGAAKLNFADAFDSDFTLLLRQRRFATLTDMAGDAIEVEANLMASGKMNRRSYIKSSNKEETHIASSSQTIDANIDMIMKTMERLMERLVVEHRQAPREPAEGKNKNQNFRRP